MACVEFQRVATSAITPSGCWMPSFLCRLECMSGVVAVVKMPN